MDQSEVKPKRISLADLVDAPEAHGNSAGATTEGLPNVGSLIWKVALIVGLVIWANWWQFEIVIGQWRHNPNWSFGPLIPLFSLYLLYIRRHDLMAAKRKGSNLGLPVMLLGILVTMLARPILHNYYAAHLAMLVVAVGLVLFVAGWRVLLATWVPILFLFFCMPFGDSLYTRMALPLQNIAAQGATLILKACHVQLDTEMSSLTVTSMSGKVYPLTVAEACSGMRSLMAFAAIGVAMAYIENRMLWQRIVLMLAGLPIAVFCNVLRVTFTCTAYVVDKPQFGDKFMHTVMGVLMLIPAFFLLWLLGTLLKAFYVEDDSSGSTGQDLEPVAEASGTDKSETVEAGKA